MLNYWARGYSEPGQIAGDPKSRPPGRMASRPTTRYLLYVQGVDMLEVLRLWQTSLTLHPNDTVEDIWRRVESARPAQVKVTSMQLDRIEESE